MSSLFEAADLIHCYSEEDAIADGVLFHPYAQEWPWLLVTASVHFACDDEAAKGERTYNQVLKPLLMDAIIAVRGAMSARPDCDLVKLEDTVAGTVWIRPNSKGGMTVMKPSDN
jgi:hypothetical protein